MITIESYAAAAIPHLQSLIRDNAETMRRLQKRLVSGVEQGQSLLVFGSGHSGLFPLELYHRAGGASFVVPVVADYLMPTAGPPVVRALERTPGVARAILNRARPRAGEMIWIASQSGINSAVVDLALYAKELGLFTVAFTSLPHSRSVESRHASKKRLFEVCDETVDLGGKPGDAAISTDSGIAMGPLSTLGSVFLGHSLVSAAAAELEAKGHRCVYTSVNTPEGEKRNKDIEARAADRDPLLL